MTDLQHYYCCDTKDLAFFFFVFVFTFGLLILAQCTCCSLFFFQSPQSQTLDHLCIYISHSLSYYHQGHGMR